MFTCTMLGISAMSGFLHKFVARELWEFVQSFPKENQLRQDVSGIRAPADDTHSPEETSDLPLKLSTRKFEPFEYG